MLKSVLRTLLPIAVLGLGLAIAGCSQAMTVSVGDEEAVPLARLDMSGTPPTKLVLAGPDRVMVTEGTALDIQVSGDPQAVAALRFTLDKGTLGILRAKDWKGPGTATIAVTMPAPREIVLAGSGSINAPAVSEAAEVNIAGSGTVTLDRVAASRLAVNVMGSGKLVAAGRAERLAFNLAGSGTLAARGLEADRAEVNIVGSGGGEFASDGTVAARIAGSGDVTVHGRAECKITAMGSGTVRCRNSGAAWEDAAAPAPEPPPPAA